MSSAAVRGSIVSALVAQFSPAWPYVETFGLATDNELLPPKWMSADFAADGEERLTIEVPSIWLETGVCRIVANTLSAEGSALALAQSDAVCDFFRSWRDDSILLRIDRVTPPSLLVEESDGRWLTVAVDILYSREFTE